MVATSRNIDNYTPVSYPRVIPVTVGTVEFLFGCSTPDLHGVLVWCDEVTNTAYSAVVNPYGQMFTNSVITSYSQTASIASHAAGWTWAGVTAFNDGTNLYAIASGWAGNDAYIDLYIADDINVPTSWSHLTEIQHTTHPSGIGFPVEGYEKVGEVTILDTGRWVWSGVYWHRGAIAYQPAGGIWTSDNQGVTWTNRLFKASDSNSPHDLDGFFSSEITRDPTTNLLYWFQRGQSKRCYVSANNGTSWTSNFVSTTYVSMLVEDWVNTLSWAYKLGGSPYRAQVFDSTPDPLSPSGWIDSGVTLMDLTPVGTYESWQQFKTNIVGSGDDLAIGVFCQKYTTGPSGVSPCVDAPLLHIPYKDRLAGVVMTEDEDGQQVPSESSMALAADHDFDNLKVIERWARDFMHLASFPDKCFLHIPYKFSPTLDPAASFDNIKAMERWADHIAQTSACRLIIPHPTVLGDWSRGDIDFPTAQAREFDNYKAIERWGQRFSTGECCAEC